MNESTIMFAEKQCAENRERILGEYLSKYGRHLRSCELVQQPFTDSHYECTCGFSEALDCEMCNRKGYVVNLKMTKGGFYTGYCFVCGRI